MAQMVDIVDQQKLQVPVQDPNAPQPLRVRLQWEQCQSDVLAAVRNLTAQTTSAGVLDLHLVPGWLVDAPKRRLCAYSFIGCLDPPLAGLGERLIPLHPKWAHRAQNVLQRLTKAKRYLTIHIRVEGDMRKWCRGCDDLNVTTLQHCLTQALGSEDRQVLYIIGGPATDRHVGIKKWKQDDPPHFRVITKNWEIRKKVQASYQGWAAIDAASAINADVHVGFKGSTLSGYVHAYRKANGLPGHERDFNYNEVCMNGVPKLPVR